MSIEAKKKIIVITLMVLCTFFLALANKSLLNNKLDSVKLSKEDKERFAIKIEDSNGDYIDYNEDTWPGIGYVFNEEKSKCTTKNGEVIDNILEYTNGVVTVTTKKTVHCYLYFDIDNSALATTLLSGDYTLYDTEANLEAGTFYRYSGAYDGKRNVIYADHCWQIFRTTKNQSIKMIYNGEPAYDSVNDKYTCDNNRANTDHIGYTGSMQSLGASSGTNYNFYYGTGYYYDETAGAYKLSGEVGPYNWYYDHDSLIGMYTCKNKTANANCTMGQIYYVESYYDQIKAYVLVINTGMTYDRIGKVPFNYTEIQSPASVGYMYNKVYKSSEKVKKETVLSYIPLISSNITTWGDYYYGDRTEGSSVLNNAVQGSSITDYPQSWIGKYTLQKNNQSYTNSTSYYVSGISAESTPQLYYATFKNNETKDSDVNKYLFGTGYISNGDGTVTITGAYEISRGDWYESFKSGDVSAGKYMCEPESYIYDSSNSSGICSAVNIVIVSSNKDFSYVQVNIKYGYSFEERTAVEQQDGNGQYKLVGNNGLTNSLHIMTNWNSGYNNLNNSHYTCLNESGTCDTLYFVIGTTSNPSQSHLAYIELNGGETIDMVLNKMLNNSDINSKNSRVKDVIDLWYKYHVYNIEDANRNLLSLYLDTSEVFCNNRSSSNNYGGWNSTGDTSETLMFSGYAISNRVSKVSCVDINNNERVIDEFSLTAGNESLTYPIGLPSYGEMYIQSMNNGSSAARKSPYSSGVVYLLGSPSYAWYLYPLGTVISANGNLSQGNGIGDSYGVRPSLSLNHNVIFSSGDGTMTDPWIATLSS